MAGRQDPPGKPGVMVAIGIPKPDGKSGRMAPPGAGQGGPAGKMSPDEAIVIRANEHCIDCQNYNPQDGSCSKVDGNFDPQDSCHEAFSPISGGEPDADDQGGPSDQDADDSQ